VQNLYNLANRKDDPLVDALARENIAYVPFFPLGGFSPLQSSELSDVANASTPRRCRLRSPGLLKTRTQRAPHPGTSSRAHLRENLAAAELDLPGDAIAALDGIGKVGARLKLLRIRDSQSEFPNVIARSLEPHSARHWKTD